MQGRGRIHWAGVCLLAGMLAAGSARAAGTAPLNASRREAREPLGSLKDLSDTPTGYSRHPVVAVTGQHVYVAWEEFSSEEGFTRVLLRVSHDEGKSFGKAMTLTAPGASGSDVALVAEGSRLYVAWAGGGKVVLRVSRDRGKSFGPERVVSESGRSPTLAVTGDHVYVAWTIRPPDRDSLDLFLRASHDGGRSFGPVVDLDEDVGGGGPQLVAKGHHVYAVWDDGFGDDLPRVFFRRSTDRGASFEPIVTVSRASDPVSSHARLAVHDDDLYLTWSACESPRPGMPTPCEVLFRRSTNEGASFRTPVVLSEASGRFSEIAAEDDHVYVTWQGAGILLRKSDDEGASFGPILNVSRTSTDTSLLPLITAEEDVVRVVWEESATPGFPDIFYSASHDEGDSFLAPVNLSNNPGASRRPRLVTSDDDERTHFVWEDGSPPGSFDVPEVLYRHAEED